MRHHFRGLNKKEIIDAGIAALIVENAPTLLVSVAPSLVGGTTGTLASGAVAYLLGKVLKKPTVSNVGIAVAVAKLINDNLVSGLVSSIAPRTTPGRSGASSLGRLGAYSRTVMPSSNYASAYALSNN